MCFIHPKGDGATPLSGEGVLIELVQAPPDVIAAAITGSSDVKFKFHEPRPQLQARLGHAPVHRRQADAVADARDRSRRGRRAADTAGRSAPDGSADADAGTTEPAPTSGRPEPDRSGARATGHDADDLESSTAIAIRTGACAPTASSTTTSTVYGGVIRGGFGSYFYGGAGGGGGHGGQRPAADAAQGDRAAPRLARARRSAGPAVSLDARRPAVYWGEGTYYEFTAAEADAIEARDPRAPRAVSRRGRHVIERGATPSSALSQLAIALVERSWRERAAVVLRPDRSRVRRRRAEAARVQRRHADQLARGRVIQWTWLAELLARARSVRTADPRAG